MSPTSDDSSSEPGGARIRAKARVGAPRIRPEVTDALSGLERSLVDVATWERLQPSPVDPPASERPSAIDHADPPAAASEREAESEDEDEVEVPLVVGEIPPPPGAPDAPPEVEAAVGGLTLPPEMIVDLEPRSHPVGLARGAVGASGAPGPLLSQFLTDESLEGLRLDGPVLPTATGVAQGYTQAQEEAEEAARRRRNGQVLTWAGVVVLAAVALLWLVPDRSGDSSDSRLPTIEDSTTTQGGLLLDPNELTTTSTPELPTTMATEVTVPGTTRTTAKNTRSSSTTATTRKPPPTTTTGAPTSTLGLPSGPTTSTSAVRSPKPTPDPDPPTTTSSTTG